MKSENFSQGGIAKIKFTPLPETTKRWEKQKRRMDGMKLRIKQQESVSLRVR